MKKRLIGLGVAALMVGSVGSAGATLVNQGNGVIWDDVADQYWYQDVGEWNNSEYMETLQTIDLSLNGADDSYQSDSWGSWRMAGMTDMENLWGNSNYAEIKGLFVGSTHVSTVPGNVFYLMGRFNVASITYLGNPTHSTAYLAEFTPTGSSTPTIEDLSDLTGGGWVYDSATLDYYGAWVVADATPTPEPATMLLFGTGLVGLVGSRLRKKKK